MKRIFLCVVLLIPSLCYADRGKWNYIEVQSGYAEKDWDIYRTTVTVLLSADTFSAESFCAVLSEQPHHVHCYKVKGTIKKSIDIYGDDIVATFSPQETGAISQCCKGKYLRTNYSHGVTEEMNFLCNGSNDFRSFKRFTKNKP